MSFPRQRRSKPLDMTTLCSVDVVSLIYKIASVFAGSHWTSVIFSQSSEKCLTSFSFCIRVQRHR